MLLSITATAQPYTHVESIGANYGSATPTVTFRVWWSAGSRVEGKYNSKVWLFVDYKNAEGSWLPADVSPVSATAGTITPVSTRGFWLQAPSGNAEFSSTVTVQLTNAAGKFNWCAYVSDCPPNMVLDAQTYYFKGTPSFILEEANGTVHEITVNAMPKASLTFVPTSITDKTGCPGYIVNTSTCPYTGTDRFDDLNHTCQLRASGAQNWEAWIKDARDNELYRIVYMPDSKWWTAEVMRYDASATKQSYRCPNGDSQMIYNRPVVACSLNWTLPSSTDYNTLMTFVSISDLRRTTPYCTGSDAYGFAVVYNYGYTNGADATYPSGDCMLGDMEFCQDLHTSNGVRWHFGIGPGNVKGCEQYGYENTRTWMEARCVRIL